MADTTTTPASASLPQPPNMGAQLPTQNHMGFENGSAQSHMPPPLNIPQNPGNSIASPTSATSYMRRSAPEPNKRALYVGGLDQRVTEDVLKQIFETTGHVQNVKIIPDKNVSHPNDCIRCFEVT